MPELRRDPVVGRWVIVAPERAERPNAFLSLPRDRDDPASCPFCPGHEATTPPEVLGPIMRTVEAWADVARLQASEIERVFREEYGRAVALLVRIFGDVDGLCSHRSPTD